MAFSYLLQLNGWKHRLESFCKHSPFTGVFPFAGCASGMRGTLRVETEAQLAMIRRQHCTEVQGFLLARPMPAEDVSEFLRTYVVPAELDLAAPAWTGPRRANWSGAARLLAGG
jgi:hypothetical protein